MNKLSKFFTLAATGLTSLLAASSVYACPKIGRLPDFNCDGKLRGVVLGDSLAYGFGDTVNDNKGGYVLRTQRAFPEADIENFGVQGLMTRQLVLNIEEAFSSRGDSAMAEALVKADFVILDVGRNDRWLFGEPLAAVRNIKRAQTLIKSNVLKITGTSPLVITAVLMLPNRGSQGPWVKELDRLIAKLDSKTAPADLRFDLVSKRLLSSDQIHPTSKGYASLAQTLIKYLLKTYPKHAENLRADADQDGLYDEFESSRYGTDPTLQDTDGDGVIDGKDSTPAGDTPAS